MKPYDPLPDFNCNDPQPFPIPKDSFLKKGSRWWRSLRQSHQPSRPVETDAERREKLGWKIIGAQINHTSRHHP